MNKVNERATQWTIVATGDFPLTEDQVQKVVEEVSDKLGEFASQAPHAIKVHLNVDEQEALKKLLENSSSCALQVCEPVEQPSTIQGLYELQEKLDLIERLQLLIADCSSTQECISLAQGKLMGLLNSI